MHRFEGTVNQYTGDGIMALFGAPIAHEDHAQRACYAALHLRDALRATPTSCAARQGLSFSVRIGLNSGEVVVGKIGDDLRMDYTAQGHTVGLAQRMEQRAARTAPTSPSTRRAWSRATSSCAISAPSTSRASASRCASTSSTGVGALRTRLDRSRARGFSRFVGRADEMAVLETALDRALDGRGGVVGVVAEAGVGKSRLCLEFVERCRARGIAVYEAHCPSHGKLVPLLPILEMLRDFFGIAHKDGDQLAREKIAGRMLLLDRDLEPFLPLVFDFLGVPDPQRPAPTMDPAVRQRQLFAFTRRLIQARSAREPAVLFVDDVHWIDDGSDAFLAQVADVVPGTRTMLLLNFRPEYSAEWMARPSYQQLPLHPLGAEAIDELLADLLGADPSLARLPALMRERTGGNPFFIEEIVHSLVESGSLVGQRGAYRLAAPIDRLEIPPTVHGILAARIDRLPEREKSRAADRRGDRPEVLRAAAAPGVRSLATDDLEGAVAALRRAELIHEESLYPEVEYAFRHPLTHEVAERSQLAAQRRRVHVAVARALEELHADKPDEHAALLAHHWDLGGEAEPAARWHRRAAEWIAGSNSPRGAAALESGARARRRRWLTPTLGVGARPAVTPHDARVRLAARCVGSRGQRAAARGRGVGRDATTTRAALAALYNAFAIPCAFSLGDPRRARELAAEGLRLAQQAGDAALACALELRLFFVVDALGVVPAMIAAMEAVAASLAATIWSAHRRSSATTCRQPSPACVAGRLMRGAARRGPRPLPSRDRPGAGNDAVEVTGWLLTDESFAVVRTRGCRASEPRCTRRASRSPSGSRAPSPKPWPCTLSVAPWCSTAMRARRWRRWSGRTRSPRESSGMREPEMLSDLALAHCALGALADAQAAAEQALGSRDASAGSLRAEILRPARPRARPPRPRRTTPRSPRRAGCSTAPSRGPRRSGTASCRRLYELRAELASARETRPPRRQRCATRSGSIKRWAHRCRSSASPRSWARDLFRCGRGQS